MSCSKSSGSFAPPAPLFHPPHPDSDCSHGIWASAILLAGCTISLLKMRSAARSAHAAFRPSTTRVPHPLCDRFPHAYKNRLCIRSAKSGVPSRKRAGFPMNTAGLPHNRTHRSGRADRIPAARRGSCLSRMTGQSSVSATAFWETDPEYYEQTADVHRGLSARSFPRIPPNSLWISHIPFHIHLPGSTTNCGMPTDGRCSIPDRPGNPPGIIPQIPICHMGGTGSDPPQSPAPSASRYSDPAFPRIADLAGTRPMYRPAFFQMDSSRDHLCCMAWILEIHTS